MRELRTRRFFTSSVHEPVLLRHTQETQDIQHIQDIKYRQHTEHTQHTRHMRHMQDTQHSGPVEHLEVGSGLLSSAEIARGYATGASSTLDLTVSRSGRLR